MKSWTIDEMLAEHPCPEYTRERIAELWAGRPALTLLEIFDLPISAEHRMWPVWRSGALTELQQRTVLTRIVTRAVERHALKCGVVRVERWADDWLAGRDRTAARAAGAAWAAEAAWAAGAAGAAWAAWSPEYTRQIEDMRAVLAEEEAIGQTESA